MFIRRRILAANLVLFLIALVAGPAPLYADAAKLVAAVPIEMQQVLSGGLWTEGEKTGSYKAFVVNSGENDDDYAARVFLQWIAIDSEKGEAEVHKTMAINEVNNLKLSNAFLYLDGEEENEITLVVTSFNPETEEDSQIWVKAKVPGEYEIVPAESDAEEADAEKDN